MRLASLAIIALASTAMAAGRRRSSRVRPRVGDDGDSGLVPDDTAPGASQVSGLPQASLSPAGSGGSGAGAGTATGSQTSYVSASGPTQSSSSDDGADGLTDPEGSPSSSGSGDGYQSYQPYQSNAGPTSSCSFGPSRPFASGSANPSYSASANPSGSQSASPSQSQSASSTSGDGQDSQGQNSSYPSLYLDDDGPTTNDFNFANIAGHKYPDFYVLLYAVAVCDVGYLSDRIHGETLQTHGYANFELETMRDITDSADVNTTSKIFSVEPSWQISPWWHLGYADALHVALLEYLANTKDILLQGGIFEPWTLRALTGSKIIKHTVKDEKADVIKEAITCFQTQPVVVKTKPDASSLAKNATYAVNEYAEENDQLSLFTAGSETEKAQSVYGNYSAIVDQLEFVFRVTEADWNTKSAKNAKST